jgi:hypothetical protein
MLTNYPCSIVTHGMGLNITVQSYDRSLDFGLMADARAMPDVRALADAIGAAFESLRELPLNDDDAPLAPSRALAAAHKVTRRKPARKSAAAS